MKALLVAMLAGLLLLATTPAAAKVCYHCKGGKPVPYVCANSDTFKARKNARNLGCNWSSYSSSCKCGAWVASKSSSFMAFALSLFPGPASPAR